MYKPFFVAFFWTIAICLIPAEFEHIDISFVNSVSNFLQMAAWSNIADIKDVEDLDWFGELIKKPVDILDNF